VVPSFRFPKTLITHDHVTVNKLTAYLFVVGVGSGVLGYYSTTGPLFALAMLAILGITLIGLLGTAAVKSGEMEAVGRFFSPTIILWVIFLSLPLIVMAIASEVFPKGMWTSYFFNAAVFCLGVVLGLEKKSRGTLVAAAVTVVAVGTLMNLFEFFFQNNMWSIAPGRSAGFYVNPNISAANLSGYSFFYFAFRARSVRHLDYVVLAIVCAGIFVTFSRSGYVLFALTGLMCFMARSDFKVNTGSLLRFGLGLVAGAGVLWLGVTQIMPELQMSEDASRRLASFMGGTAAEDFANERASLGVDAWRLFQRSPFAGIGFLRTVRLDPGPHNMYVAVALAYGIVGLIAYVALIVALLWIAFKRVRRANEAWLVVMTCLWLSIYSLASHNILYESTNLLVLSIAVALAGRGRTEEDDESEFFNQKSCEV
jgi:O-antigen ligase